MPHTCLFAYAHLLGMMRSVCLRPHVADGHWGGTAMMPLATTSLASAPQHSQRNTASLQQQPNTPCLQCSTCPNYVYMKACPAVLLAQHVCRLAVIVSNMGGGACTNKPNQQPHGKMRQESKLLCG